jgi:predicted ThiF/HesA family dinucleotide-utilizing enzyme
VSAAAVTAATTPFCTSTYRTNRRFEYTGVNTSGVVGKGEYSAQIFEQNKAKNNTIFEIGSG